MRTLLVCHEGADLDREGLARWLGSFSTFAGAVVIREPAGRLRKRIAREIRRVGVWRFLDVLAFRAYYAVAQAAADRSWERSELERLRAAYPRVPDAPEVIVPSPNAKEAEAFIRAQRPDIVIARCKTLLAERIFAIPRRGTFVMHPGICPEYRNAHGCFWARAAGDDDNVGMTLLRIDKGVDTGPVFGYFRVKAGRRESHVVTQHRVVTECLDAIRDTLIEIESGAAVPIDTSGRRSAEWGQPWLSAHVRMRRGRNGDPERVALHESRAESVAPHESRAESVTPHESRAESVAPHESRAESVAPHESRAQSVALHESRAESVALHESRAESVAPHQTRAASVALHESGAESVAMHQPHVGRPFQGRHTP